MFDADKYYIPDKKVKLGGRVFDIPIIPAIVSFIITKNSGAYSRFGTADEDDECRAIVFDIIAHVLNQRVPKSKHVDSEWVEKHLDMRQTVDLVNYIFSAGEEEKKTAQENEGGG